MIGGTCGTKGPLAFAEVAFVGLADDGVAVNVHDPVSGPYGSRWTFRVERPMAGSVGTVVSVLTPMPGGGCGAEFRIGGRYEVYAKYVRGKLMTFLCSGNRVLSGGRPFTQAGPRKREQSSPDVVTAFGVAALVAIFVVAGKRRTRQSGPASSRR